MRRVTKRSGCHLLKAPIVGLILSLAFTLPVVAADPTPTSQPASPAPKYDQSVAERAKETVHRAMTEMKKAGETITVKVKEISGITISEQVERQLKEFEEKSAAGKATLKDQLRVIDIMQAQCNALLKFIADTKGMNLAQMKEQAIVSLMQLSQQLGAKANQIEAQAIATTDPEWQAKMHELAASADRFARAYARWADTIRAYPVEAQLRQLHLAEEYLKAAKEMLTLMEDYLNIGGNYHDFTAQVAKFMQDLNALHSGIQKFARLVNEVPSEMPAVEQEPEADGRSQPGPDSPTPKDQSQVRAGK